MAVVFGRNVSTTSIINKSEKNNVGMSKYIDQPVPFKMSY